MEIDDIKASWNNYTGDGEHMSVSEVLRTKSRSPLVGIKKQMRKQIFLLVFSVLLILKTFMHKDYFHDVFFWCYLVAICSIIAFFLINYRMVARMGNSNEQTASHLREYISVLEKRLQFYHAGVRVLLLFFILLSETLVFFADEPMLVKWHMIHPVFRVLIYVALLMFHHFLGRYLYQRRYGKYFSRLREVLDDLNNK